MRYAGQGHNVTATLPYGKVTRATGAALVKAQGAHHVLNHRDADYLQQVLTLTGGRGVDVVLEMLANVNLDKDLDVLALHGRVVVIGDAAHTTEGVHVALDWDRACAIALATKGSGKSVVEAVRTSVDPKVIDCPNPASGRATRRRRRAGPGPRAASHRARGSGSSRGRPPRA